MTANEKMVDEIKARCKEYLKTAKGYHDGYCAYEIGMQIAEHDIPFLLILLDEQKKELHDWGLAWKEKYTEVLALKQIVGSVYRP